MEAIPAIVLVFVIAGAIGVIWQTLSRHNDRERQRQADFDRERRRISRTRTRKDYR